MKISRTIFTLSIIAFMLLFSAHLFAQNFEGKLTYSIIYKAKIKHINLKQLATDQGNQEIAFVKKGFYKSVRYYNNDTIGSTIYRLSDNLKCTHTKGDTYSLLEHFTNESFEKVLKTQDFMVLGEYNCEVYQSKREDATYTFYILKGSDANSAYGKPANYVISPFNGILAGLTIETPTYISTRFLNKKIETKLQDSEFDFDVFLKITPTNELTKDIISAADRKVLQASIKKAVKYPFYMQLNKLEGKVYVEFIVNSEGKVIDKIVEADFFRETTKYDKISSKKHTERIRKKIADKIIAAINSNDMKNISFGIPTTKYGTVNTILKFPVIFGNIYFDERENNNVDSDFQNDSSDYNDYHDFYESYD